MNFKIAFHGNFYLVLIARSTISPKIERTNSISPPHFLCQHLRNKKKRCQIHLIAFNGRSGNLVNVELIEIEEKKKPRIRYEFERAQQKKNEQLKIECAHTKSCEIYFKDSANN
jgi:hypothetical protein